MGFILVLVGSLAVLVILMLLMTDCYVHHVTCNLA